MAEKTKTAARSDLGEKALAAVKENGIWALAGLALEIGCSEHSAAPSSAALSAGLSKRRWCWSMAGGLFGALLHGIPDGLCGIASLIIVLASRLIPDGKNTYLRAGVRCVSAAIACFFPRSALVEEPSELLWTIIAALGAGIFAACVSLLSDRLAARDFDITDAADCTQAAVITALAFMNLGAMDYPALNIGRLVLGAALLALNARKGLAFTAVFGTAALCGLSAAGAQTGRGAAVIAAAVVISAALSKFGKLTRSIGFVFISAVGILLGGIDEGNWKLIVETAGAGIVFAFLPVEKLRAAESDFSDRTVAMIMRERLCFAADAIAGISSGLNAASETLDRRYGMTTEDAAERAAERCCRSCPKSMVCWGDKYQLFRGEFERLVREVRGGAVLSGSSLSPECAEICECPDMVAECVTREYRRFLSAAQDEQRIGEMRRMYTDWLSGVRDILRGMGNGGTAPRPSSRSRTAEKRAERLLRECGMEGAHAFLTSDKMGRLCVEAYGSAEPRVDEEYLGSLLSAALGKELETPEISCSGGRCRVTCQERRALSADIGAFQLCRGSNRVCGDCYESFTDAQGLLYVVLSDGMGSGSRARVDSALACSVLAKLIKSGIPLSAALETVNTSLMVKSADESFATLDICRIDLNTGECEVYKAGAATTYIKSSDRLVRAALSSPPAGTGGRLTVPAQQFRVSAGDVIVMMTDGCVPDEEWLSRELSCRSTAKELSERIARAARAVENGNRDDISVIAVSVGR